MRPGWLPVGEFLSRLAVDLPVLEEGTARKFVESRIAPDRRRPDGHISRSTSFALRRLERSGQIKMQRMADAQAMNLELGSELRPVSHVRWLGLPEGRHGISELRVLGHRQVRQVLNTDAEYASRHIFLAVHSDYPLRATSPRPGGGIGRGDTNWTMQPQEFLQAFLSQDAPHMQVAVLGGLRLGQIPFHQLDEIQPAGIG